jgi:pimeloyl-ACP methyl ester carboxylesterase
MSIQRTSHRVPANGLEHHVLEWSTPQVTRTAVLVHGFMDAAGTWDRVAPAFAEAGLRVLAPDMRGFGEGPRAPRGSYYHFVDYVFDLADIVDALAPGEPIALVGHSMGGTASTLYAGTFPERVSRFANLEGLGPPEHGFAAAPVRMRRWIEEVRGQRARGERRSTFTPDEALRRLAANHPAVPDEILARCLPNLVRDAGDGRVTWANDPLHRTTSPMPFFAEAFKEFARKVTCPVLVVSGGPTGFHPADEDARVAAFPNATRAELPDAGHMMHWTRPDALAELLLGFFSV